MKFVWFLMGLLIATLVCVIAFFAYKNYCPAYKKGCCASVGQK
jgi:hypothetical protein